MIGRGRRRVAVLLAGVVLGAGGMAVWMQSPAKVAMAQQPTGAQPGQGQPLAMKDISLD